MYGLHAPCGGELTANSLSHVSDSQESVLYNIDSVDVDMAQGTHPRVDAVVSWELPCHLHSCPAESRF